MSDEKKTEILYMKDVDNIEQQNAINEMLDRAYTLDYIVGAEVEAEFDGEEIEERIQKAYDKLVESGEIEKYKGINLAEDVEKGYAAMIEGGEM